MAWFAWLGFETAKAAYIYLGTTAVTTAISFNVTRLKQRKAQRQAEEATGFAVRHTDSGVAVPIPCGRAIIPGLAAMPGFTEADMSPSIAPGVFPGIRGYNISGSQESNIEAVDAKLAIGALLATGRGKTNQYLLQQDIMGPDSFEEMVAIWVGDRSIDPVNSVAGQGWRNVLDRQQYAGFVLAQWSFDGDALPAATAFTSRRSSADASTGLAHANLFMKQESKDPRFGGFVPGRLYFTRANKNRDVTSAGWATAETYGNTPQRILCDFLTGGVKDKGYGPQLDIQYVDATSAYNTQLISGKVVQGPGADMDDTYIEIGSSGTPRAPSPGDIIRGGESYRDIFSRDGVDGTGLSEASEYGTLPSISRHGVNGRYRTEHTFNDTIEEILLNYPGLRCFPSLEGKYKFAYPDTTKTEAAQAVGTINSEIIIPGTFKQTPAGQDSVNQVVGKFNNVLKNGATDTVVYPPEGSTADVALLAEDGGNRTVVEVDFPLLDNEFHVNDACNTILLLSRREGYECTTTLRGMVYEEGDVVLLDDDETGISVWAIVDSAFVNDRNEVEMTFTRLSVNDFKYTPKVPETIDISAPEGVALPVPINVTAELEGRSILLGWQLPRIDTTHVAEFAIRIKRNANKPESVFEPLYTIPADAVDEEAVTLQYNHPVILNTDEGAFQFEIAAKTPAGRIGQAAQSPIVSLDAADIEAPDLPRPGGGPVIERRLISIGAPRGSMPAATCALVPASQGPPDPYPRQALTPRNMLGAEQIQISIDNDLAYLSQVEAESDGFAIWFDERPTEWMSGIITQIVIQEGVPNIMTISFDAAGLIGPRTDIVQTFTNTPVMNPANMMMRFTRAQSVEIDDMPFRVVF